MLGQLSGAVTHKGSRLEPCSPCSLLFLLEPLRELLLNACFLGWIWKKVGSTIKPEELDSVSFQSGICWEASFSRWGFVENFGRQHYRE